MKFWKGQFIAYEMVRKHLESKELHIAVDKEKAKETYAEHVKKQHG